MASDDLKQLIAREIASGETIAEVARRHRYSWRGMKKLVDKPEMQQLIQAERQRNGELAERCRVRLLQLGPEALDHIAEVLRNPKHPKCLETSRFVVEKILPNRTMLEAEVNVGVAVRDAESQKILDDALLDIARSMKAISEAQAGQPGFMRHVYSGADALRRPLLPARNSTETTPGVNGLPIVPTGEE